MFKSLGSFLKKYNYLVVASMFFLAFIVFTIIVKTVDVQYYYNNTYVGLYSINSRFGEMVTKFGKFAFMEKASDIIMFVSFGYLFVLLVFAIIEIVKKKSLWKINKNYFVALGGYVSVVVFYFIFEIVKVNYSPDCPADALKASYPSSHVFIGCMFYLISSYTAIKLLKSDKEWVSPLVYMGTFIICLLLVFTRSLSAKHWLSDIIASVLLVLSLYLAFIYVSHKIVPEAKIEAKEE